MKKLIFVFFVCLMVSFCFANTEGSNSESIEDSVQDMQNQLLQALNNNSALDILEENAKIMTEKNEEIEKENKDAEIKEKEEAKKKKKEARKKRNENNYSTGYLGVGCNFSTSESLGFHASYVGSRNFFTIKMNGDFNSSKCFFFSGGLTPIHSDNAFLGLFATAGTDSERDGTLFGVSGTFIWNFARVIGFYFNLDCIKYSYNWKLFPTLGLSICFLND